MKLDLAAGRLEVEGYERVDVRPLEGVEHVVDLTQYPWPWPDESVEAIRSSHYVEHVVDLVAFMNECHRILVPGGEMFITHPYQHSDRAWQDPTHVRAINAVSWAYFDGQSDVRQAMGDEYDAITADFEVVDIAMILSPMMQGQDSGQVEFMVRYCVNVVDDLTVTMKKR